MPADLLLSQSSSNKKFHPKISQAAFRALASYSPEATALFEASSEHIYSGESAVLGYPDEAEESYSGYYPETPVFPRDEISKVQDFLESQDIATENTRLRRLPQKQDGKTAYELLIASQDVGQGTSEDELLFTGERGDSILRLKHGDHEDSMRKINECLREAQKHTATEAQSRMLQHHIDGFQSGKIASHKEAQAAWVEDKNPQVESLLGFIEYYTDPHGVRAEWRGFVLLQNQHETKSLRELVSNADRFLRLLPWNKDGKSPFENERFESPDFTSMEGR